MKHLRLSASGRILTLSLLCLFLYVTANAQTTIGRQKVDQYPITSWGTLTYGLTWLPTDYSTTNNQSYPLIIFLHGAGETGDGVGGLNRLISTALPQKIAHGWNPEAVNPVNGQNYKFIVVSPQAPSNSGWSYSYGHIQWILADVMSRYKVDPSRIYVTGLSAGGAGTWGCVTNGAAFAQKIAAIVPVAAAGTNTPVEGLQLPLVGSVYGVKVWNVCGANDAWFSFAQAATALINNSNPSVPAIITGIPGMDHQSSAWNTAYEHSWRSNSQNINIFEWMLKYTRGNSPAASAPAANQGPVANAGPDQSVGSTSLFVQLNGNGSDPDGSISSYNWNQVSGPSAVRFNNAGIANPTFSGFVAGAYMLRLTVKDNKGATATDDVSITINANVAQPASYANISGVIEAENYSAMSGVQTENTADQGGGLNVGWQEENDWIEYAVNVPVAGTYNIKFRVATINNGVQFQLRNSGGSVLKTITVPNTGWWQTWQTVSTTVSLPAGQQTLRILTTNGLGWNINWWQIEGSTVSGSDDDKKKDEDIIKIQAESYASMNGIKTENTVDEGGGINVGWQENNDWMDYSVNITSAGTYAVNFRVATINSGVQFQLKNLHGTVLQTITVPNTGGWQNWQTIAVHVPLPAGQQTLRIYTKKDANGSGWNLNWWEIQGRLTAPSTNDDDDDDNDDKKIKIQAEDYTTMNGIKTENTLDANGGLNVGWQETGDWMEYSVMLPLAGTYIVKFRVATINTGVQFQLRNGSGTVLETITVPNTGLWQNWQTVSIKVELPAGQQTLRIYTNDSGWNLNWFEMTKSNDYDASKSTSTAIAEEQLTADRELDIFPNPVQDRFVLKISNQHTGPLKIDVFNTGGILQKQFSISKSNKGVIQTYLSIGDLQAGQYIIKVYNKDWNQTLKIIKQ